MNFIFVGGCGHSGTSLITAMLGAHSRIFAIPVETAVFRKALADHQIKEILAGHLAANTKPDISYVCEKTPAHVFNSKEIVKVLPGAKLVFIVRDPRDVVASYKRRGITPPKALARWNQANKAIVAATRLSGAHAVKFEDLVQNPQSALSLVCKYLDLDFETRMLEYWRDEREWFDAKERKAMEVPSREAHRVHRNWQIHQPIMNDRVGNYEKDLSASEISLIVRESAKMAARFGYQLNQEGVSLQEGESLQASKSLGDASIRVSKSKLSDFL